MPKTLQVQARVGAMALLLVVAMGQIAARAAEAKAAFLGRWTVDNPNDKFSANGRLYRVIDFVSCGKEFCGISVEGGVCGATLFRVPNPETTDGFGGRAKWGNGTKELVVQVMGDIAENTLSFELGDKDSHLGSRNSVPTYAADYHKIGKASCVAEAPAA